MKYRISKKGRIFVTFDFSEFCALHGIIVYYFNMHSNVYCNKIYKRVIDFIDGIFCDYCSKNRFSIKDFLK